MLADKAHADGFRCCLVLHERGPMFDALIRIGGSLAADPPALRASCLAWPALARRWRLLALPGGGPFADQVRAADAALGLSDDAAHWMAILAMDQYGHLLADLVPGAGLASDLGGAAAIAAAGGLALLAPFALLRAADPLPHSWQVTSDSIAAWLAAQAGARLLVLLKDVAGVCTDDARGGEARLLATVSRRELARYNVVDAAFAQTRPAGLACWIIDGRRPERLAELLATGATYGTQVLP